MMLPIRGANHNRSVDFTVRESKIPQRMKSEQLETIAVISAPSDP